MVWAPPRTAILAAAAAAAAATVTHAFVTPKNIGAAVAIRGDLPRTATAFLTGGRTRLRLAAEADTDTVASALPEIDGMKAGDIRNELESYGISTKSFLEKSELVDALRKAREEGKTPIKKPPSRDSSSSTEASSESKSNSEEDQSVRKTRDERIKEEMDRLKSMKVGDLRKKLNELGISTKSFFEKSEFVRALAEATVDGVKKSDTTAGTSSNGGGGREEEERDPSYRDVVMQKFNPRALGVGGSVIDVRLG
mmetsp:Transcript_7546/g.16068  ORF Transcript_7546/g.16068 Transcript_7546/m.16068 type:complete len:253 (-) Transcript_7546:124-882(-)|eukprot:CAMPEP_0183300962 /NCGR_PEP_ID=MMETSP0160_2-20130417/7210_1 /TAXON_ID=2839 ORGANISM="Odontella Sinensis, Strain Grunow 1884" /NCGR_SAMPLE_ID=MMETSP0160_2 /ASSEMBLY_ACC=CAM_ASM_000250 /LENGTH=252 /DNA_ID=CAMNT_0025463471 /DNA_START=40 /DNA_END=798 /DNA_ORIENTATION=+